MTFSSVSMIHALSVTLKVIMKLNEGFSNICNWFVDNKVSIHIDERKEVERTVMSVGQNQSI